MIDGDDSLSLLHQSFWSEVSAVCLGESDQAGRLGEWISFGNFNLSFQNLRVLFHPGMLFVDAKDDRQLAIAE